MSQNFLTKTYLDGLLNAIDDPQAGSPIASPSGAIVEAAGGQLGATIYLSEKNAANMSNTATGTLHEGFYRYVQFYGSSSGTNALGQVVFWQDAANYVVTPDAAAANLGQWVGVALLANTKGNFGWIQIAGRAGVLFKTTPTKATPAAGDLVIVDQAPSNKGDVLADATGLTSLTGKSILGVAFAAPVGGAVSLVDLWSTRLAD